MKEKGEDGYGPLMELIDSQFGETEVMKLTKAKREAEQEDAAEEVSSDDSADDGPTDEEEG